MAMYKLLRKGQREVRAALREIKETEPKLFNERCVWIVLTQLVLRLSAKRARNALILDAAARPVATVFLLKGIEQASGGGNFSNVQSLD